MKPLAPALPEDIIYVLVDYNPKMKGCDSHRRFALYRSGMTVWEALSLGVKQLDLVHDQHQDFIVIDHEPKPKKPEVKRKKRVRDCRSINPKTFKAVTDSIMDELLGGIEDGL